MEEKVEEGKEVSYKLCGTCSTSKPTTCFVKDRSKRSGLSSQCRTCKSKCGKARRARNRERNANTASPKESYCYTCKNILPSDHFYKAPSKDNGLSHQCKKCKRDENYKKQYGISLDDYNKMLSEVDNTCEICNEPDSTRLAVDHCHTTGQVRGLLCRKCNTAIGLLRDRIDLLESAIKYLEKK